MNSSITFISLNMWQGGNLFESILEFLKQEDADVLLLQEVYAGELPDLERKYRTLEVLQKELGPSYYYHFAPAFLDNREEGKIEQGKAIFSKFPILSSSITFFNEPYNSEYTETPR